MDAEGRFAELIRDRTGLNFVAREWLYTAIERSCAPAHVRYVLVTGEPGAGKTSLMAGLALRNAGYLRYFVRRDSLSRPEDVSLAEFLLEIGHQFVQQRPELFISQGFDVSVEQDIGTVSAGGRVVGLQADSVVSSPFAATAKLRLAQRVATNDGEVIGLAVKTLTSDPRLERPEILARLALTDPAEQLLRDDPDARIVLLVDGLDELASTPGGDELLEWLTAGPELPSNVRLVLTSREHEALERLRRGRPGTLAQIPIDPTSPQVAADLARYADLTIGELPIVDHLRGQGLELNDFLGRLVRRAAGNFQYLAVYHRALDDALRLGDDSAVARLTGFDTLPSGLADLYGVLMTTLRTGLARMGQVGTAESAASRPEAWREVARPILGVLTVAVEPLALGELVDLAGVGASREAVGDVLRRMRWLLEVRDGCFTLFHGSLAEFLRAEDPADPDAASWAVDTVYWHRQIVRHYLGDTGSLKQADWRSAGRYALTHLAHHAAEAGRLDDVLADGEYLVYAEPRGLSPHLHLAASDAARLTSAIYRNGLEFHAAASPEQRRNVLALQAARAGAGGLQEDLIRRIPRGQWLPLWSTGTTFSSALRNSLTSDTRLTAVACTILDGVPAAVTGGSDGAVRVWDLRTGQMLSQHRTGHTGGVSAVACTVLDGAQVAVTGGSDGTLRVCDLRTGQALRQPRAGRKWHSYRVSAVACTDVDGAPVAVTGSYGNVVVWDLRIEQLVGQQLSSHYSWINAVVCTELDGLPVAVTSGGGGEVFIWDLRTRQLHFKFTADRTVPVNAVACIEVGGVPVVLTGSDSALRLWNLRTGQMIGQPLSRTSVVRAAGCTVLYGMPVAVTCSYDGTVQVWDLQTRKMLGQPLLGHTMFGIPTTVAFSEIDGAPVAVTSNQDETVRVWDLQARQGLGRPVPSHDSGVLAVACTVLDGTQVAVTGDGGEPTVRVWAVRTGEMLGQLPIKRTKRGYVWSIACAEVDGVPVAVTGESHEWDSDDTVRVWDLRTRQMLGQPLTVHDADDVACTTIDGTPVAVVGGQYDEIVRVLDLRTRQIVRRIRAGYHRARRVACTDVDETPVALTGGHDGVVRMWNLRTGQMIGQPFTGHTDYVSAIACTHVDGIPVAVTGSADGTTRMWNLRSGREFGPPLVARANAFTPVACGEIDGRPVAITASGDRMVQVWDLRTRTCAEPLPVASPRALALTAAGEIVVAHYRDISVFCRQNADLLN
jgi:WD40 repeat protein